MWPSDFAPSGNEWYAYQLWNDHGLPLAYVVAKLLAVSPPCPPAEIAQIIWGLPVSFRYTPGEVAAAMLDSLPSDVVFAALRDGLGLSPAAATLAVLGIEDAESIEI